MKKQPKVTYKELMGRLEFMFGKLIELTKTINYSHTVLLEYIKFKEDTAGLTKYLKKEFELNKEKENDKNGSNPGGDREDKSGTINSNTKSTKLGKEYETSGNKADSKKYC